MNTMLNHTHIYKSPSVSEKRLIYAEKPGALETLWEGAGELLSAGADLLKLMTSVLKSAVNLVRKGYAHVENGVIKLSDAISDPGKPSQLSEYDELTKYLTLTTSQRSAAATRALKLHACLVFLEFKTYQLAQFHRPAVEEFNKVERRLESISKQRYRTKKRRNELEDLIKRSEDSIKNGVFIKGSNREVKLRTELRGYRSELHSLNDSISTVVLWAKPQTVTTEFPGSGRSVERFVPDRNQRVKVDLEQLYSFLKGHVKKYDPDRYLDEMEKLAYHRDKLLSQSVPQKHHPRVTVWMDQITTQGVEHKNEVSLDSFKDQGTPKSLSYLERAESAPKQVSDKEEVKQVEKRRDELLKFLE